jgi:uncharacterized protein with HEPN domain
MNPEGRKLRQFDYVEHILEAIRAIDSYVADMSRETFLEDRKTQQAVIFNLMIIGEAAAKIANEYPEWAAEHAEIPWRAMRGMRNRLAHGYFEINLEIVWETV